MRYRVTIRGEGTELRGYATYDAAMALGKNANDPFIVVASPADDDYNPFGVDLETKLSDERNADDLLRAWGEMVTIQARSVIQVAQLMAAQIERERDGNQA